MNMRLLEVKGPAQGHRSEKGQWSFCYSMYHIIFMCLNWSGHRQNCKIGEDCLMTQLPVLGFSLSLDASPS